MIQVGRKKFGQAVKNKSDYKNASPNQNSSHSRRADVFVFIQLGSDGRVIAGESLRPDAFLPHFVFVKIAGQKRGQNNSDKKGESGQAENFNDIDGHLHI